jgi:hypothetical protein
MDNQREEWKKTFPNDRLLWFAKERDLNEVWTYSCSNSPMGFAGGTVSQRRLQLPKNLTRDEVEKLQAFRDMVGQGF